MKGLLLACCGLCCIGCASGGILEQDPKTAGVTTPQLDLLVLDYAYGFATRVAAAADRIGQQSDDAGVRRHALRWKLGAVSEVYLVAAQPDPALSLVDLWTLAIQQREFLAGRGGDLAFGPHRPDALAAAEQLERRIQVIAGRALRPDASRQSVEAFVTRFAGKHPIDDLTLVRDSIAPEYVDLLRSGSGLSANIAALRSSADTSVALALVALRHGPEIVQWKAELALADVSASPGVARSLRALEAATEGLGRIDQRVSDMPAAMAGERTAFFADLGRLREDATRDVDTMRRDTLATLRAERQAILAAVREEREAIFGAVREETTRALAAVSRERAALTSELPTVADLASAAGFAHARETIDHAFYRALQLVAVVAVLGVAGVIVVRRGRASGGGSERAASDAR